MLVRGATNSNISKFVPVLLSLTPPLPRLQRCYWKRAGIRSHESCNSRAVTHRARAVQSHVGKLTCAFARHLFSVLQHGARTEILDLLRIVGAEGIVRNGKPDLPSA